MAYFAKLDSLNIVTQVLALSNDVAIDETTGISFLQTLYGSDTIWMQTSYNTHQGIHYISNYVNPETNKPQPSEDQSKAFRKNYAGIGFTYDKDRDAFIPPMPEALPNGDSWVLDETTCNWFDPKAPIGGATIGVSRV